MRSIDFFERIVRSTTDLCTQISIKEEERSVHPFDERNVHPSIAKVSIKLFDNAHYSQATFEAFKFLDTHIKKLSGINESGFKLMMAAFAEGNPKIVLNEMLTSTDHDEQSGFRFILAGAMSAIRNPRAHEVVTDPVHLCLDHLSLASVLLRRIEERKKP